MEGKHLAILGLAMTVNLVTRAVAQSPISPNENDFPSPSASPPPECLSPNTDSDRDRIFIQKIEVLGSTVLQSEIQQLIHPLENRELTLKNLLCLRSKITELYLQNGYINSGAFLPNHQDLSSGTARIQVVEGNVERIDINGLQRLQPNYVRIRLESATTPPLNQQRLQEALELLQLNPLFTQVNAELTAGSTSGQSVLIVNLQEAPAFHVTLGIDNYRPPSIGQGKRTRFVTINVD